MKRKQNILGKCPIKARSKYRFLSGLFLLFCSKVTVYASDGGNKIANSTAGKGTINLFNDASAYLLIISPIVGAVLALYFLIRKNAADEQDQKQWNKRLIITGICVVGAVLTTGTINVVTSYYQ